MARLEAVWRTLRRKHVFPVSALGGLLGLLGFRRRPWLWIAIMALGYVLSLGPYLRGGIAEEYVAAPQGVRLPGAWFFKYVPFYSRLFSPVRMECLFLLGYGVLVAWAVARAFQRCRVPAWARPLLLLPLAWLVAGQMGRAGQAPLTVTPVSAPERSAIRRIG